MNDVQPILNSQDAQNAYHNCSQVESDSKLLKGIDCGQHRFTSGNCYPPIGGAIMRFS